MSDTSRQLFKDYMRMGEWFVEKAERYENAEYYSDAKSNYATAMDYFEKAKYFAGQDDYNKYKAIRRCEYCRTKIREIGYEIAD